VAMKVSGGETVIVPIEAVRVLIDVVIGSIEVERVLIEAAHLVPRHAGSSPHPCGLAGAIISPQQPIIHSQIWDG
jgi:hypothetical protein